MKLESKNNLHSLSVMRVLFIIALFVSFTSTAQTITSDPLLPTDAAPVTIYFDATGTDLEGYTGDLYTHTGVNTLENGNWQYVIGSWGNNQTQPQLERLTANTYKLEITPSIRQFYSVPESATITGLAFVFRAAAGSPQSPDLFVDVFESGTLNVAILNPPKDQPILELGQSVTVLAAAIESDEIILFVNNEEVASTNNSQLEFAFNSNTYGYGTHWIKAMAVNDTDVAYDSTYLFIRPDPVVQAMPAGLIPGINYTDNSTVTLVLHDPPALKDYVFVLGDFNEWMVAEEGYMKVTPSGNHFWLTLSDLTPDTEYAFQYFIDNEVRIPDPYTHKVLDPWNDHWITSFNYPDLKPYPVGKTTGYVSIMHPGRPEFQWEVTDFTPPAPEDMVIYELLIRDFVGTSAIKTVMDSLDYLQSLGVNVIELMPINQFEGNISWGYNPAMYFATDKAYGTREDYKRFINECHKRGIAVVLDIVLNHSFNLSPQVQMYFDPNAGSWGQPSADNPWFLQTCPHEPWCWGNTYDQNSPYVHEFFNRVTEYWLTEFKVDGFRFDFTKGFTNVQTGGQGWNYDAARIANLKRIADHMWSINPNAYVILEHFTDNNEEKELSDYGMMLWGNVTHAYQEAAMGWINTSNFEWASYKQRGWDDPHLIAYMESHDEERMMYRNLNFANSSSGYNIREMATALRRTEMAAAFYFPIPGPKMIWQFGELGYDFSINHCQNGTINDQCRTDPKPIRWDYYDDWRRKRLYDVYSMLTELKKEHDVFRTDDYSLQLSGAAKRIHLNHESNEVTILGNFGVTEATFNPNFQRTGTWYEFFSRETYLVDDLSDAITLQPGEYRLYSRFEFPDHGVPLGNYNPFLDEHNSSVSVYPNPSSDGFTFTITGNDQYNLRIVNLQGQTVFEKMNAFSPANSQYFWNNSLYTGEKAVPGIYFFQVFSSNESHSGKIVIR